MTSFQIELHNADQVFSTKIGVEGENVLPGPCLRCLTNSATVTAFLKWAVPGPVENREKDARVSVPKLVEFCFNAQNVLKGTTHLGILRALGCALEAQRLSGHLPAIDEVLVIKAPDARTDLQEHIRFNSRETFIYMAQVDTDGSSTSGRSKPVKSTRKSNSGLGKKKTGKVRARKMGRQVKDTTATAARDSMHTDKDGAADDGYEGELSSYVRPKRAKVDFPLALPGVNGSNQMWSMIGNSGAQWMWQGYDGEVLDFARQMQSMNQDSRASQQKLEQQQKAADALLEQQQKAADARLKREEKEADALLDARLKREDATASAQLARDKTVLEQELELKRLVATKQLNPSQLVQLELQKAKGLQQLKHEDAQEMRKQALEAAADQRAAERKHKEDDAEAGSEDEGTEDGEEGEEATPVPIVPAKPLKPLHREQKFRYKLVYTEYEKSMYTQQQMGRLYDGSISAYVLTPGFTYD
jgi:hypothetical protein